MRGDLLKIGGVDMPKNMNKPNVLYADCSFEDLGDFENAMAAVGAAVVYGGCKTQQDVIASGSEALGSRVMDSPSLRSCDWPLRLNQTIQLDG
jgi:hypothetical protein